MRVLVIPGYFGFGGRNASGSSGAGVFFRDQAVALARAGHDASLLYVHFDAAKGVELEVTTDDGVRCLYVHAAQLARLNSLYRMLLMIWAVRRTFVRGTLPEVVHAHVFHALPGAWAVSRAFGIPYVVTEHSSKVRQGSLNAYWRVVARLGYGRAARIIAVSEPLARSLAQYTSREVTVIPNLVRDELFDSPLEERQGGEPFTFLSIGYCDPVKGWHVLLQAFARLHTDGPPRRLVLCGAVCPELETLARKLGVSESVRFLGRVSPQEIPRILNGCDCHVMPSTTETFGIASIESLALGRPVIMTATDAAALIVNSENGFVVPTHDVEALAGAMRVMLADHDGFEPVAIRQGCREKFSGAAVTDRLTVVLQAAVRRW